MRGRVGQVERVREAGAARAADLERRRAAAATAAKRVQASLAGKLSQLSALVAEERARVAAAAEAAEGRRAAARGALASALKGLQVRAAAADHTLGLRTVIKPLLSHSTTGEFNS
eukprot:1195663-Prorocentrum_minimum.AAC.7